MSKHTIEFREIIEIEPYKSELEKILNSYTIEVEEHRNILNEKIINHFMFYEIGILPTSKFLFNFNKKLHEIMPYYNQLYKSENLEYNPLYNIELIETFKNTKNETGKNINNGTSTSINNSDNVNIYSDTPNTELSVDDIKTNKYATNTAYNNSVDNNSNTVQSNTDIERLSTDDYVRETKGSSAGLSFSKAIAQWRDVMINIDMMIIDELEELFLQIY